ncbi:MAG: hypothetical protein HQL83_01020 [Magnetococcales bacterium]|nr:hypothetical protein [Magnetococcales bacterium]
MVNLPGSTATRSGLRIQACLDENICGSGIHVSGQDFACLDGAAVMSRMT